MSSSKKSVILVTEPLSDRALEYLADHGEVRRSNPETVDEAISTAEALVVRSYTQVNEALLAKSPNLKVVGRAGVALENIDIPACRARGIEVVHTPEANTLAVVDYTIAAIINMNRRFWPMSGPLSPQEFHAARKPVFGRFLSGLTLGIIGAGRIGSRVGRAAVGLGMKVIYNDIREIHLDYPAEPVEKPALYAAGDIITVHTPLTDLTRGLICAETIGQFKKEAQFINCARGPIVNYHDLAEAIRSMWVSAATIDCHDPEPPPPDYAMFALDSKRVTLTPHTAARVPQAIENMCDVVYDVVAVLQGRQPTYPAADE